MFEQECQKVINKLKSVCEARGLTYYELAHQAKISVSTVYSIMKGDTAPRLLTLFELCQILEIPVRYLFEDETEKDSLTESEKEFLIMYRSLTETKKQWLTVGIKMLQQYKMDDDSVGKNEFYSQLHSGIVYFDILFQKNGKQLGLTDVSDYVIILTYF